MARSPFAQPRLGVEVLQARIVPAVVVTQLDLDNDGGADDIRIIGDAGKNFVTIQDNGVDTLTISIDANGDGDFADAGDLNSVNYTYSGRLAIEARLGAGKDAFNYELTGPLVSRTRDLFVALGAGNDTANIVAGDLQTSILGGAQLDVDVYGGIGHDTVNVTTGKVDGSLVGLRMDLGQGHDTGSATFGGIDNKSSVDVEALLGDGNNTFVLDLHGVGKFNQADMHVDIVGGIDVDTVTANLHDDVGSGQVRSSLEINADLGAGNDKFAANLDYGGGSFRVDNNSLAAIAARGGAGDDTLVVNGIGATGTIKVDDLGLLDISLKGGAGNDKLGVNLDKTDGLWLEGAGGIRMRIDGGNGNDTIAVLLANDSMTTGNYDVAVNAGAGDDIVAFALDNNGGTPTFSPKMITLDGGLGNDTLTDAAKPISAESFFETII